MDRDSSAPPIDIAREVAKRRARLFDRFCTAAHDPATDPTVLVVAAHPVDEVIGAGVRLARLRTAWLLHLTDGAPRDGVDGRAAGYPDRDDYARARRLELLRALRLAGIGRHQLYSFGLPDQTASENLADLARRIRTLLAALQPEIVLTHPYEGGHPDHDSAAFAVHAACALYAGRGAGENGTRYAESSAPPLIVEFTSYHAGSEGMVTSRFLDGRGVRTLRLSEGECALKRRMLDCYATQHRVLSWFTFETESFRPAPRYDFTAPPHQGRLWYEWFDWGMAGERWRRNAQNALEALGLEGALRWPPS
jgi:LmbE family N-acetylglucosaminyl deacetylase